MKKLILIVTLCLSFSTFADHLTFHNKCDMTIGITGFINGERVKARLQHNHKTKRTLFLFNTVKARDILVPFFKQAARDKNIVLTCMMFGYECYSREIKCPKKNVI